MKNSDTVHKQMLHKVGYGVNVCGETGLAKQNKNTG